MKKSTICYCIIIVFCVSIQAQKFNPGDGVRITFFNISETISGEYFIQQNGIIQLPYVGLINTSDKDFEIVKSNIIKKYELLYKGVELIVLPLYKINILGEVKRPGIYYVTGVEKLTDIIAIAGGETEDANLDKVFLVRQNNEMVINFNQIVNNGKIEKDILLRPGDRIYVSRKWWVVGQNISFLISGAAVMVAVMSLFMR